MKRRIVPVRHWIVRWHYHCHGDKTVTALRLWVILSRPPAPNCLIFQRSPLITALRVRVNVLIEDCVSGIFPHFCASQLFSRALPTFLIFILLHERLLDLTCLQLSVSLWNPVNFWSCSVGMRRKLLAGEMFCILRSILWQFQNLFQKRKQSHGG